MSTPLTRTLAAELSCRSNSERDALLRQQMTELAAMAQELEKMRAAFSEFQRTWEPYLKQQRARHTPHK